MSIVNVLIPVHLPEAWRDLAVSRYQRYAAPGTHVLGTMLSREQQDACDRSGGLEEILLQNAQRSENEHGVEAHIIDCFGDPGMSVLADKCSVPVVGVGQVGLVFGHVAFKRFSVITSESDVIGKIRESADRYGVSTRLDDVRAIEMHVTEIYNHRDRALAVLVEQARTLDRENEGIVLGCTELAQSAANLRAELADLGWNVRVIHPVAVAIRAVEAALVAERAERA